MSTDKIGEYLSQFNHARKQMVEQLGRVIIGQSEVIDQILAAIFTKGHCLLVGVPGLAKTLMVSSLSQILDVSFRRVQFTPDLMPSDITGTTVLDEKNPGKGNFALSKARFLPIFFLRMRLIEPRLKPRQRFCRRWRNGKSLSGRKRISFLTLSL